MSRGHSAAHVRHIAVLSIIVVLTMGVSASRLFMASPPVAEEFSFDASDCTTGVVSVTWRLDGEIVGCLEDLRDLLAEASRGGGCKLPLEDDLTPLIGVRPGVRVELGTEKGVCRAKVLPLSGAEKLALGVPIDLNCATAEDFAAIRGIGPVRAEAIVRHRETNGLFAAEADLVLVRGIGPATLERVAPYVSVGVAAADGRPHPCVEEH